MVPTRERVRHHRRDRSPKEWLCEQRSAGMVDAFDGELHLAD